MNAMLASRGLKPLSVLAAGKPHGVRLKYLAGCRCDLCRRANSTYENERQKARRNGDWNGIVSAGRARAHLLYLSRQGIGKLAVQASTDLSYNVLVEIRMGLKPRIRARTERKILAVNASCRSDHAYVSARRTWRLIGELLEEGYTRHYIAWCLGYARPYLQINRTRVLVCTAQRVARLHRQLTA